MRTNVLMIESKTGNRSIVFRCESFTNARALADHMNHLNADAARMTGKAIKFIYAILPNKEMS